MALSFNALGGEKFKFECTPKKNEASFRIKGQFEYSSKPRFLGIAHSYKPFGVHKKLSGCRTPWYEKFPLKGELNIKFMLHAHEYMQGCKFRLVIPTVSGEGRMWVFRSGDAHEKTNQVSANCVVTQLQ